MGRRDPSGITPGPGMTNFPFHHFRHGTVPDLHALADLAVAMNAGLYADIHVVGFITGVEDRSSQVVAQVYGSRVGLHSNLGACAVQEPGGP